MSTQKSTVKSLVNTILGEDDIIADLGKNRAVLEDHISYITKKFKAMKETLADKMAALEIFNGRIKPIEYNVAKSVLVKAENDLFDMGLNLAKMVDMHQKIGNVLDNIEASRKSENKTLVVERYLNDGNMRAIEASSNIKLHEHLVKLNRDSKILAHAVNASIDLKVGS